MRSHYSNSSASNECFAPAFVRRRSVGTRSFGALIATISFCQLSSCDRPRPAQTEPQLVVGQTITIVPRDDKPHWHRLRLEAGTLAEIRILQQGIDIVAEVHAPDSKLLAE